MSSEPGKEKLEEASRELQNLTLDKEAQLKKFGISLADLTESEHAALDEYVAIKTNTNLHNLDETFLREWLSIQQLEELESRSALFQLKTEISKIEDEISAEEEHIRELNEVIDKVRGTAKSESEMELLRATIDKNIEGIQKRQDGYRVANDVNLTVLIEKIAKLKNDGQSK